MFNLVHSLTDTPDAVFLATCDVIQEFHDDNVIYLELRSTPRAVKSQMTKDEYIGAIIKAIEYLIEYSLRQRLSISFEY